MYQPSDSPIFPNRAAILARKAVASDARLAAAKAASVDGRRRIFNTLVSPQGTLDNLGIGAAINTAKLQDQTETARASGLVVDLPYTGSPVEHPPEVVPMTVGAGFACGVSPEVVGLQSQSAEEGGYRPVVGMPHRAPVIVNGPYGPMYYRGADSTVPGSYTAGHEGADAVPGSWLMEHSWLVLALAGVGVYALSRRAR